MSLHLAIFWVLLLADCCYAMWRGGWPEKTTAWMLVAATLLTIALRPAFGVRYAALEWGVFAVDVALAIGLAVVASKADRWWPMPVAALQLITVAGHVGTALNPNVRRLGYELMIVIPAFPILLLLLAGIVRADIRGRRTADPS